MTDSAPFSLADVEAEIRPILESAAVLERFDAAALAEVGRVDGEDALTRLRSADLVALSGEGWRLLEPVQDAVVQDLEQRAERMRELRRQVVGHYAARLRDSPAVTHADLEHAYMRHFEALCEALIQQEPALLEAEVDGVPFDLLHEPAHRHLISYYRGIGAGFSGRFDAARRAFEQLMAEPDLDDVVRARALNSDAVFARNQGDYERALDGYRQSHALWTRLGNRMRQGLILSNLGVLHYELQQYDAAERNFHESAILFEEIGASYHLGRTYNELGLLRRDQGEWREALQYLDRAERLFEQVGAADFLGCTWNNIGEVEMLRGRFDAATMRFQQALRQASMRSLVIDISLNLGLIAQAQGDYVAALQRYRDTLDLAQELGRRDVVALGHYRIGNAQEQIGDTAGAQASYEAAIAVIEDTRAPLRDEGLMISLMGRWQQVYEAAVILEMRLGDTPGAFALAERARARAFADVLARRGSDAIDVAAQPAMLEEVQVALCKGTLLLVYFATGLRGQEAAMLTAVPRDLAALRGCLVTPPHLFLFAVGPDGVRGHDCRIDPNALRSPHLQDGRRFLAPQVLRRVSAALLSPVADLLHVAQRLVVVPHGPLHQLPFAALGDSAGTLLDHQPPLAFAPSATLLSAIGSRPRAEGKPCLALGYDGDGRALRHTEPEAATVVKICGGDLWTGAQGVCERLRAEAGQYRRLHLACHGEFDLDDPLRSWLEVGPGERLSAAEIIEHWSLDAELVTLSACRSGISRILHGDEPMGLVRALLQAGARSVLVTLWPVEDISARILMQRFYELLLTIGDPARALQQAQCYLRDLPRDELVAWLQVHGDEPAILPDGAERPFADPFFWAPYALVGAPAASQ